MALERTNLPARLTDRFILRPGTETLREAVAALHERDGHDWWYLLVDVGRRGELLAVRFADLIARILDEGPLIFNRSLMDIGPPLVPAAVVDASASRSTIERLAAANPNGLVVLAEGGQRDDASHILGVINIRETRNVPDPDVPTLSELAEESEGIREAAVGPSAGAPPEPKEEAAAPAVPPAAPPAPAPAAPEPQPATTVEGDLVTGDKRVEGDEVHGDKYVYLGSPPEKTTSFPRRVEAAFPQECELGKEQVLWVAIMLPEAESPFASGSRNRDTRDVSVPMPVDAVTGDVKPADIEVSVTATGFRIEGEHTKLLTVWPDGRTAKRWFQLQPEADGEQTIRVELSMGGRLLDELSLSARVFASEKRPARGLNLSLSVAVFGLSLSFAAGG
jgi:hypothetical protein